MMQCCHCGADIMKQIGTWRCEKKRKKANAQPTAECVFVSYHCSLDCDQESAARMHSFLRRFDATSGLEVCPASLAHVLNG